MHVSLVSPVLLTHVKSYLGGLKIWLVMYTITSCLQQTMALKEIQEFANVKPHKILHPSQTWWLSLHSVVKRLLAQLPALKLFFNQAALKDRLVAVETMLQKLHDPFTKLYLEFLDHVLPFSCDLNKEMQAQDPKIYTLKDRISAVLVTILECYIKPSYLNSTPLNKTQEIFFHYKNIYLGGRVTATLQATGN